MAINVRVTALSEQEHAFLEEVFSRAIRAGLIEPDELAASSSIWYQLRRATTQTIEPPTQEPK